eukprot:75197-Rhodomonas_salina.1
MILVRSCCCHACEFGQYFLRNPKPLSKFRVHVIPGLPIDPNRAVQWDKLGVLQKEPSHVGKCISCIALRKCV